MSNHDASVQNYKRPNYWLVFASLGILTALEIAITVIPGLPLVKPLLLFFMTMKAVLVAMFYMHLRSDSRWFTTFILLPIPFIVLFTTAMFIR